MTLRRRVILAAAGLATAVAGGVAFAPTAQADSQLCYDLDVQVNGEQVVDEAACEALPALPALP